MRRSFKVALAMAIILITLIYLTIPEQNLSKDKSTLESHYFGYPLEFPAPLEQAEKNPTPPKVSAVKTLLEEKFLTYLPHDNFYKQKIAVENAILLAYYLNRTLILPPAYLGTIIEWDTFDAQYTLISSKNKYSKTHCSKVMLRELSGECLSYTAWTKVPWSYFFDLSKVKEYVRMYEEADFTSQSLQRYEVQEKDVYFFKENAKYEHKFSDATVLRDSIKGHFQSLLHYSKLKEYDEKLLFIHSLNGRGRVQASHPANYPIFRDMLKSYVWANPVILKTADIIISKLGGRQNYLGVEIPTLELEFSDKISINLQSALDIIMDTISDNKCKRPALKLNATLTSLDECVMRNAEDSCSSPLIYLSTDSINPRTHVDFIPIFQRFPCTFTRHDFLKEFASLGIQPNREDHINLAQHMISMVETEIIARGSLVATAKNSMQGVYSSLLHDIYYHKSSNVYPKIDFSG